MVEPRVVVVVSNYSGTTTLYRNRPIIDICLESLKRTSYKNYKVVVVDDCSPDNSVEHIKAKFPNVALLKGRTNVGFARSTNNGITFALGLNPSYVLLLNNDIIITDRDWLGKLVEVAESDKGIGIVGCKLVYPNGKIQHAGVLAGITPRCRGRAEPDKGQYDRVEDMEAVVLAATLIKKAVIKKIGMLDGNFFMGYEDTDYCIMARYAGFRVVYDGEVELTHLEGATSTDHKDKSMQDTMFYTYQRNYAYYTMKHFGMFKKVQAAFVELAASIIAIESKDRARVLGSVRLKSRPLWRLGKTIQAAFDGYAIYKSGRRYQSDHRFVVIRNV